MATLYSVQENIHGAWSEVARVGSRDAAISIAKQNRKFGNRVRVVKRSDRGSYGYKYPTRGADTPYRP
jgi:hypothetical protein